MKIDIPTDVQTGCTHKSSGSTCKWQCRLSVINLGFEKQIRLSCGVNIARVPAEALGFAVSHFLKLPQNAAGVHAWWSGEKTVCLRAGFNWENAAGVHAWWSGDGVFESRV